MICTVKGIAEYRQQLVSWLVAPVCFLFTQVGAAQDWLVLRDRGLVTTTAPLVMTEDGIRDGAGEFFPWQNIAAGNMSGGAEGEFVERIRRYGEPLFQMQSAITRGDWLTAASYADLIDTRQLSGEHVVHGLGHWSRHRAAIAAGDSESAAVHLVHFCESPAASRLAEMELLKPWLKDTDLTNGISAILAPVSIDRIKARIALTNLQETWPAAPSPVIDGRYLYGISLALSAGDKEMATELINQWKQKKDGAPDRWLELTALAIEASTGNSELAGSQLTRSIRHWSGTSINDDSTWYWTARFWKTVCETKDIAAERPVETHEAWRFLAIESGESRSQIPLVASLVAEIQARDARLVTLLPSARIEVELQRSRREGYNCQSIDPDETAARVLPDSGE